MSLQLKKRLSTALLVPLALSIGVQGTVLAADKASEEPAAENVKEIPFPPDLPNAGFSARSAFLYDGNIGNDFVQAQVSTSGRFNAGLRDLSTDNWYNTIYSWPNYPGTSFTSLKIDGSELIYGNDGEFISPPTNNEDNTVNESVWKNGDVSVKQVLQADLNPATGQPDALQIRYVITNTGTENHEVGLRVMLDTMVNGNDAAPFKVPSGGGIESVDYERDYIGADVPSFWQVFNNFDYPDISAQYTMGGGKATLPDRFTIANWGSITGTVWDYQITPGRGTGDSAVGMWWDPVTLAPGKQKIITTYYGRPGVGGSNALVLSGRKKLTYEEWSSSPFNLISYFTNNTAGQLDGVKLQLEADAGLSVVGGSAETVLGTVANGETQQSSWKLQATTEGVHTVTVNALADGSDTPIATATYELEALAPVVPPNISLGGVKGTHEDGTPTAGRTSPFTVNATYNSPQASSVTLEATDSGGAVYVAQMTTEDNVNWTHTFTPWAAGLWGSPMTVKLTPTFPDGSTGPSQQFPIELIDPSGYVYNDVKGDSWRLPGATVVLQYFDPLLSTWVNMSEEAYPGRMSPITNPEVTGDDGMFAWDTAAGTYHVVVSRPGFATATSRDVTVPPPVTDLNVALTPTDATAPTLDATGATEGGIYTSPITIDASSTDDAAGVRYMSYQIDGAGEVQSADDQITLPAVSGIGSHTITLKAVDHAGNEKVTELHFTIKNPDSIAPTTQLLANSAVPTTGWYNADNIAVQLQAADNAGGSGVDKSFYRVNGGSWKEYTAAFTLSGAASYKVDYYSQDAAGNVEGSKTITLKVDRTAPVTSYKTAPIYGTKSGVKYIKGYTWTLTATDAGSGVKQTFYRINGGAWKVYTVPFEILSSNTPSLSIDFYSEDQAGNQEKH